MTYQIINEFSQLDYIDDNIVRDINNIIDNENDIVNHYFDNDEETEMYDSDDESETQIADETNNEEDDSDSEDEISRYDVDVMSDARFVVGSEVVGRNIYNTVSDLEDARWISYEILEFLEKLYEIEEERNDDPNNYQGNVHEPKTPAYEQMENITYLIEKYENESQ